MIKFLIVEDQISNQFLIVECLQKYLQSQNVDIKIASNGLDAIKIVEKFDFDIILMDLQMPVMDGLKATREIIKKYSHIKIIILTSFNDIVLIQECLKAGARGYLLKDNLIDNLKSTIQNVNNGYSVCPVQNMTIDKDYSKFNFTIFPDRKDKILKINKIAASIIINSWLTNENISDSIDSDYLNIFEINFENRQAIISFIIKGDSPQCNIDQELELRFERLILNYIDKIDKTNLENTLDIIIKQLNNWFYTEQTNTSFYCFKSRLEANAQTLRIKYIKEIKKYADLLSSVFFPVSCLEYMELLEKTVNNTIKEYHSNLTHYIEQEKSAFQAYSTLIDIYFQSNYHESERKQISSLFRAILYIYRAKMHIEALNLGIQALQGIVRTIQFNIDDLILVINLLKDTQRQLGTFNTDENIYLLVGNKFDSIQDSNCILKEIETEFGYGINQWSICSYINSDLVLNKIMKKISVNGEKILKSIEQELSV